MNKRFILVNDPDHGTLERLKNVFNALNDNNILITTAVFCTLEEDDSNLSKHCYRGETGALDEPEYKEFMLEQKERGHEIAFHGYSQISNTREKFQKGLETYKEIFGEYPFTYIEHGGHPHNHPPGGCKKERLDWFGSDENSKYYIKDIVEDKISCIWAKFDLLDGPGQWRGKNSNLVPKRDSELFYKEGSLLHFKRWRSYYFESMFTTISLAKQTTFIAYTHFGYDGYAKRYPIDNWTTADNCKHAAEKIRNMIDSASLENKTLKEHILDRNLI